MLGFNKISKILFKPTQQAIKQKNLANFNKKYAHLLVNDISVNDCKKQADSLYREQINRKKLFVLDNVLYKKIRINNISNRVAHGHIVKACADLISKGKLQLKTVNLADSTGRILTKYEHEGLDFIQNYAKKGSGINISFGLDIPIFELENISESTFNADKAREILNKMCLDNNNEERLSVFEQVIKLADKGVKLCIAAGNNSHIFAFRSLARLLTKNPENIKVVGASNKSGSKIKMFCNDERIITDWRLGCVSFEPIIHKYKILGFAPKKSKLSEVRSISIKPIHLDNFYQIRISNKFSGLTLEQAIQKLERMNKKNNTEFKFIKNNNGSYSLKYSYYEKDYQNNKDYKLLKKTDVISFEIDQKNKLSSKLLQDIQESTPNLIGGTSFSSPRMAAEFTLQSSS